MKGARRDRSYQEEDQADRPWCMERGAWPYSERMDNRMNSHSIHVVKYGDKYCRFGSYSKIDLVDNPLKASTYIRKSDAIRRMNKDYYITKVGYVNGQDRFNQPMNGTPFKLVLVTATCTEQEVT